MHIRNRNQKEQMEEIKPLKNLDPAIRATLYTEKW